MSSITSQCSSRSRSCAHSFQFENISTARSCEIRRFRLGFLPDEVLSVSVNRTCRRGSRFPAFCCKRRSCDSLRSSRVRQIWKNRQHLPASSGWIFAPTLCCCFVYAQKKLRWRMRLLGTSPFTGVAKRNQWFCFTTHVTKAGHWQAFVNVYLLTPSGTAQGTFRNAFGVMLLEIEERDLASTELRHPALWTICTESGHVSGRARATENNHCATNSLLFQARMLVGPGVVEQAAVLRSVEEDAVGQRISAVFRLSWVWKKCTQKNGKHKKFLDFTKVLS